MRRHRPGALLESKIDPVGDPLNTMKITHSPEWRLFTPTGEDHHARLKSLTSFLRVSLNCLASSSLRAALINSPYSLSAWYFALIKRSLAQKPVSAPSLT